MTARRSRWRTSTVAVGVLATVSACTTNGSGAAPRSSTVPPPNTGRSTAAAPSDLTSEINAITGNARYSKASWSVVVADLGTGKSLYTEHPDTLAFTGSVRKLFSVGLALKTLGPDHRTTTPVYRTGTLDTAGVLHGNLNLVGAGDLTLGGRRTANGALAYTDFDHNDANNLGTASLTPQDPLAGVDQLARQVRAAGITTVDGDVVIDDRLFPAYRVPNNDLLITPTMLNENMVDVTITPTRPGQPATLQYRPKTAALKVISSVRTTAAGTTPTVSVPDVKASNGQSVTGLVTCAATVGCTARVSGTIPVDYRAPLSGDRSYVGTFRVEDPEAFARTAFIQALQRIGVKVATPTVGPNPTATLPASTSYPSTSRVAALISPTYAHQAKLILKVSLNLGANLALTQFGLTQGDKTRSGALAAERKAVIGMGVPASGFDFPSNGSGSPDSRATPLAIVKLLTMMSHTNVAGIYQNALPVLGVDGSLAHTGTDLAAKGHVYAKTGTTLLDGKLKAQTLAGYVDTLAGHRLAFAICLNDYGPINSINDVLPVFSDEAAVTDVLYRKG